MDVWAVISRVYACMYVGRLCLCLFFFLPRRMVYILYSKRPIWTLWKLVYICISAFGMAIYLARNSYLQNARMDSIFDKTLLLAAEGGYGGNTCLCLLHTMHSGQ